MRKFKVIFPTVIAFLAMAISIFTYIKYQKKEAYVFKCDADVRYDVKDENGVATIDALYVLSLGSDRKGFLHMTGVVKRDGIKNDLNRTYYFDYTKNTKIDIFKMLITEEKVSVFDGVDSAFFHETFLPEKPGQSVYIKANRLRDNLYVFNGFSYTHLLCSGTE